MITISILGLDQFVVGEYSHDITEALAEVYEVEADDIYFYAPLAYIFHNGVDQSAYNVIVKVEADARYQVFERSVFELIQKTLTKYVIHFNLQFVYFNEEHVYSYTNDEYPLFMTDVNTVEYEEDDYEDYDDEDEVDVYNGDIFEGFDEKVAKKREEKERNNFSNPFDEFKNN